MDHAQLKMGLREPHANTARAHLADYRLAYLPASPLECDWTGGITDWGMLANDRIGLCAIDGPLHMIMAWRMACCQEKVVFSDGQTIAEYVAVTGSEGAAYDPASGANDNGCVLADVMARWQYQGLAGHQIDGWVQGQAGHMDEFYFGHSRFGGCLLGVALPLTARDQMAAGKPWTLTSRYGFRSRPDSWGRHCVYAARYGAEEIALITWGGVQICTPEWLDEYMAEVQYPVSADFLNAAGHAPSGLDLKGLLEDLAQLGPVL